MNKNGNFVFAQTGDEIQEILNKADAMDMATSQDIEDFFGDGDGDTDPSKIVTLGGLKKYKSIVEANNIVIDCHMSSDDIVDVPPGTFNLVKEHLVNGHPSDIVRCRLFDSLGNCHIMSLDGYNLTEGKLSFSSVGLQADSVSSLTLSDGDYAVIETLSPSGVILNGEAVYEIEPNGRAVKQIPIINIPPGYSFGAYRGISLNGVPGDGESFKLCAIQFFGTANSGKSANVAIKNFSSSQVRLIVRINALFTRYKMLY